MLLLTFWYIPYYTGSTHQSISGSNAQNTDCFTIRIIIYLHTLCCTILKRSGQFMLLRPICTLSHMHFTTSWIYSVSLRYINRCYRIWRDAKILYHFLLPYVFAVISFFEPILLLQVTSTLQAAAILLVHNRSLGFKAKCASIKVIGGWYQ